MNIVPDHSGQVGLWLSRIVVEHLFGDPRHLPPRKRKPETQVPKAVSAHPNGVPQLTGARRDGLNRTPTKASTREFSEKRNAE